MIILELIWQFILEVWYQLSIAPNPFIAALILFVNGLWIPFIVMLWGAGKIMWQDWRQTLHHIRTRRFIILAIDVPRDNNQSPLAVENIFTHLHGILPGSNNMYENWWEGKTVDYFSVELVSIEGYVQFLVYTQEEYRDIVESAFYAQYPDAEITQVEDYVYGQNEEFRDLTFPSEKYDIFGTEFVLAKNQAFPIRSWRTFEHTMSQELKDPMASLLENMNKIGPGEQMWLQWVITPEYDYKWQPQAENVALGIAGKKVEVKQDRIDKGVGSMVKWLDAFGAVAFPFYTKTESVKEEDMPSLMLHLTPGEQQKIEAIQLKADKVGFWSKFRFVYIGEKAVFSKARGVAPMMGSLKQLSSANTNSLNMHKWTKTSGIDYWMVEKRMAYRKNNILRAYQDRSRASGSSGVVFNTEELATMYHFPTETVKAPLVSRTQSKRSSAPVSLPLEQAPRTLRTSLDEPDSLALDPMPEQSPAVPSLETQKETKGSSSSQAEFPTNLPFV